MASTDLTAKQTKFVAEYLVDSNGARAAVAAGYGVAGSRVAAHRLLTKANVRKALQARQSSDATELSIQRNDVLQSLLKAYNMALEQCNPAAMVSAARECGRMMGYYAPERQQVEVMNESKTATRERLERMSDAELMAMITSSK